MPAIEYGAGSSKDLFELLSALDARKPLIVTDSGILALGLLDECLENLTGHGVLPIIYSDVQADPPESNVCDAVELAISNSCDSVVGFGGGSAMDVAKLIAVLANAVDQGQAKLELSDLYGVNQFKAKRLPLVQIPTTAGTGSEATAVAIITTGETTKSGVVSPILLADKIVLDPSLTLGLPAHITAATGIDAMVHAVEAYTSKRLKNPLSDAAAAKALALLSNNIKTAVNHGTDIAARSEMLLGAMLAGQAFANAPVGGVHALAYPLGGVFHVAHGLSNSLVLPHVLRFNASAADELYSELASILLCKKVAANGGEILAEYFSELADSFGLPTTLREVDVREGDLANLAEQAMLQQRLLINNPRPLDYSNALDIYAAAF